MALCLLTLPACSTTNFMVAKWKDWRGAPGEQTASVGNFKVGKPYVIDGRRYYPEESYTLDETGIASWYGPGFHGKYTANGEEYNQYEITAAHRTLQLPALVRITNLENGKSIVARVNDRGPFSKGRIIDVSKRGADLLGFKGQGTAKVRVQVLGPESRRLADIAKSGGSTRGMEVAFNENSRGMMPAVAPTPVVLASTEPQAGIPIPEPQLQKRHMMEPVYTQTGVRGHVNQGRFYPDPVVTQFPVTPSAIFVQAGAYASRENAVRASETLKFAMPVRIHATHVRGQTFHRLQVGPLNSVEQADQILDRVIRQGFPDARILVDNTS